MKGDQSVGNNNNNADLSQSVSTNNRQTGLTGLAAVVPSAQSDWARGINRVAVLSVKLVMD